MGAAGWQSAKEPSRVGHFKLASMMAVIANAQDCSVTKCVGGGVQLQQKVIVTIAVVDFGEAVRHHVQLV